MEATMTLDQFRATGRDCDDLRTIETGEVWDDEPGTPRGRVYLDGLFILRRPEAGWPNGAAGEWHLALGREDWLTDDLRTLEARLYGFAMSSGWCEPTIFRTSDGYTLYPVDGRWQDAVDPDRVDMTFDDKGGRPVDVAGVPLDGALVA
jgi:hypothetical protein